MEPLQLQLNRKQKLPLRREESAIVCSDIMTEDIIAVCPGLRLELLAKLFAEQKVSGFPVVDSQDQLLGLVSQKDLVNSMARATSEGGNFYSSPYEEFESGFGIMPGGTVEDIMTPFIYYATPDTDIREVLDLMLEHGIHRVVVTEHQKLKGLITSSHLLKVLRDIL